MAALKPETILDWAAANVGAALDACLISCTAIKSAPIIGRLEAKSAMPVLTSNLLRSSGIDDDVANFGHLFRTVEEFARNDRP
jgi:maleate isomerase